MYLLRPDLERYSLLAYGLLVEVALAWQGWNFYLETQSPWLALNLFFSINTVLLLPGLFWKTAFPVVILGLLYQAGVFLILGVEHVLNRAVDSPDLFLLLDTNLQEAEEFVSGHGVLLGLVGFNALMLFWALYIRKAKLTQKFSLGVLLLLGSSILTGIPESDIGVIKKLEDFAGKVEVALELSKRDYGKRKGFAFAAEKQSTPAVFILVVGESARHDRWSVNGYARNTSPGLASINELISYRDVFAAANGTKHAVPIILSRATPENYRSAFQERSIAGLFAEAGYTTAWVSGHEREIYEPDAEIYEKLGYGVKDEQHVEVVRHMLQQHKRLFLILHMNGSHYNYDRRIPPEYMRFKPTISDHSGYDKNVLLDLNLQASKQHLDNSYDNTILYADHVLTSIIDLLAADGRAGVLLYTSDHGESLWDDERKLLYHMRSIENVGLAELKVPLFIYMNNAYRKAYPQVWPQLDANRDKPVSHNHVFHTAAALADIRYPARNDALSLTSPTVMTSRPRTFLDPSGIVRTEAEVR